MKRASFIKSAVALFATPMIFKAVDRHIWKSPKFELIEKPTMWIHVVDKKGNLKHIPARDKNNNLIHARPGYTQTFGMHMGNFLINDIAVSLPNGVNDIQGYSYKQDHQHSAWGKA